MVRQTDEGHMVRVLMSSVEFEARYARRKVAWRDSIAEGQGLIPGPRALCGTDRLAAGTRYYLHHRSLLKYQMELTGRTLSSSVFPRERVSANGYDKANGARHTSPRLLPTPPFQEPPRTKTLPSPSVAVAYARARSSASESRLG